VTPNAHLASISLSTLSSCHCLGEANVTGSRVAPVSTRRPLGLFRGALHASSHPFHQRDCAALAFQLRVISVNFYSVSVCKYDSMPPHSGSPDVSGELGWGAAWRLIGPLRLPQDTGRGLGT
jgi:hypothetical protein